MVWDVGSRVMRGARGVFVLSIRPNPAAFHFPNSQSLNPQPSTPTPHPQHRPRCSIGTPYELDTPPLSSDLGTYKTVRASDWSWLSGQSL